MNQNPSPDVNAILNPPLGKKPNLSEKQMKNMRMVLQFIQLPPPQNNTYFYNIVSKQSNWGFSQNQRLLILNLNQKSISYLSKVPQGYLPFTNFDQIAANKVKQKIVFDQVTNFKCLPLKGKISSMQIQWLDKQKNQKKWIFILGSSKLMNDWIQLIGSVRDGTFDKKKYEQMNKVNNSSILTGISPSPVQNLGYQNGQNGNNNTNTDPINNVNKPNPVYNGVNLNQKRYNNMGQEIKKTQNSQNIPPQDYAKTIQNNLLRQQQSGNAFKPPFQHINSSSRPLNQQGVGSKSNGNLNQNLKNQNNSTGNLGYSNVNDANKNLTNSNSLSNTQKVPQTSKVQASNISKPSQQTYKNPTQSLAKSNSNNNPTFGASNLNNTNNGRVQNSSVSPIVQNQKNLNRSSSKVGQYISQLVESKMKDQNNPNNPKSPSVNGSLLNNQLGKSSSNNLNNNAPIDSKIQKSQYYNVGQTFNPNQLKNTKLSNPSNPNLNNVNNTSNLNNSNATQNNFNSPNDYKFGYENSLNRPPSNHDLRRSVNQSDPGDFVQQLKKRKQKNPQRFNLTNQLSQKKFQNYNPNEENQSPYGYSRQINQSNISTPKQNQYLYGKSMNASSQQKNQNNYIQDKKLISDSRQSYGPQIQDNKPFAKNKLNPSNSSKGYLNQDYPNQTINKQYSRGQLSNNVKGGPSSGLQNNYDEYQMVDNHQYENDQIYKPANNFPESTKNLSKIRSDYLQRKSANLNNMTIKDQQNPNRPYPQTSKNDDRVLKNNYIQEQMDSRNKMHKFNDPSFKKLPKFDSSQKSRQNSIQNLNKQLNNLNTHNQKSYPSYNQLWLQTSNPNKKIQIHQQFILRSTQIVKQIVQELPLPQSYRQYKPIDSYEKQNVYTFVVQNIIITLHFFNQIQSMNGSDDNINVDAPVMYDHSTYQEIKRQFYNYNLILSVTNNQGKIKVPLCSYIQYRGVLAVVRADIPTTYKEVEPYSYKNYFENVQNMIKVRFLFNTFNCYESQGYRGGQGKFILLWNLKNLIPGIPNNLKNQSSYFRKEFLLQYDQILEDLQSSAQAHAFTIKHILSDLIAKLECLELQIIHSKDLIRQLHRVGLSVSYLPQMYKKTNSIYLKRIIISQIVSNIFSTIVRSQLNHAFAILPVQNLHNISPQQLNSVIVDCCHVLVNQFFSYTLRSQSIWKLIVNQTSKRYRIIVSKQDVIPGYVLSAVVHKLNLQSDFKLKTFLKNKKFFVHQNLIPRQIFLSFNPIIRRYDMQSIDPTYSKCRQLLFLQEPTTQNYQHICTILNLKNNNNGIREYYKPIMQELKTYLASFIPYTLEQQYQYLDIYEYMYEQPITYNGVKTAFLAIKWLIKANQVQKANQIFQIKFHQLTYWIGQYNTAITQFYDFFSMFYASIGDYQESICLAKSSLINVTKILGQYALPIADKHYQLGNIYFKINKKNDALKEYNKTKNILISHQKVNIPEYGIILLKIALLCLNFGDLTQCLSNAIEAEKIFQNNQGNQNQQIQCFQILSRAYQITRKQNDINNLCQACSKTFNYTQNPKIMQRMLRIILYPKLSSLSSPQQKALSPIIQRLQENIIPSATLYNQSFNYLHKLSLKSITIKKKLYYFLENVVILAQEINRRDLLRKHSSLNQKCNGDAEQMISVLQAVGNMVGWGYLLGSLKDMFYE